MPDSNITLTPNLHLARLPANYRVWGQIMNDNLTMLDAAVSGFIVYDNWRGAWSNSTHYANGDTVVDLVTAVIWTTQVDHTSSSIPTTFTQEQILHPTYWVPANAPANKRGAWLPNTQYNVNDFVLADGTKYAMCLVQHVSSSSFNADAALGYWSILIDFNSTGAAVPIGSTPPSLPITNQMWWNSDLGQLFIWYNDGNTMQWVPATPVGASAFRQVTPQTFGAVGDGVTDDGPALTLWLASLSPTIGGYLPAGTYNTSLPLTKTGNNISIVGAGGRISSIVYTGASTTVDIFTIGDGVGTPTGWTLRGFRVSSNTTMTDGTGIRMRGFCRSDMSDIIADGQDGTGKLWNGFWFNQVDCVTLRGFYARGQNDCLRVDGGVGAVPKADLHLCQGKISYGTVGIRMGGGFGGLLIDETDIISNGTNLLIDTTLAAEANRELLVGSTVAIDGNTVACIRFSDLLATGGNLFSFVGAWIASSAGSNVVIDSGFTGTIRFEGCYIYNAGRVTNPNCDGILNNSSTAVIDIDNCQLRSNTGYGVNSTVLNNNLRVVFPKFVSNTVGTFNSAFVRNVIGLTGGSAVGIGIGGIGGGDRALTVQTAATGATTMYGVRNIQQVQSDVTANFNANATAPAVFDAAFTLTAFRHYFATQGTFGATATVTSQYGYAVDTTLVGATNNYAFYTSLAQGAGRWNFHAAGSAQNYFAGNTGVGTGKSVPIAVLEVAASTTARASLNLNHGIAPTAPVDGDIWTTTAGMFVRINGVTKSVNLT